LGHGKRDDWRGRGAILGMVLKCTLGMGMGISTSFKKRQDTFQQSNVACRKNPNIDLYPCIDDIPIKSSI
jgi:hypothetical protein